MAPASGAAAVAVRPLDPTAGRPRVEDNSGRIQVASPQARDIEEKYRWYRAATDELVANAQRENRELSMADYRTLSFFTLTPEPAGVAYEDVDADGVPCIWADPPRGAKDRVVLFFHGGAYVHGSAAAYRWFCGHLAKAVGCRVLIVDYQLAPEHPFPAQITDAMTAYRWLLGTGSKGAQIAVCGDSAGGGLALAVLLAAKQQGLDQPAACVPMSAWLDLAATSPSLKHQEGIDLLVTHAASEMNGQIVMGAADPRNPLASPMYGDYAGINTQVYVQVGGAEGLLGENLTAAGRMKDGGMKVRVEVFPEMQHIFQQGCGYIPESDEAMEKIREFLRPILKL